MEISTVKKNRDCLSAFFGRCLCANINKEGALTRLGGKMGVIWTNLEGKVF